MVEKYTILLIKFEKDKKKWDDASLRYKFFYFMIKYKNNKVPKEKF
jgi:hypothetical protein